MRFMGVGGLQIDFCKIRGDITRTCGSFHMYGCIARQGDLDITRTCLKSITSMGIERAVQCNFAVSRIERRLPAEGVMTCIDRAAAGFEEHLPDHTAYINVTRAFIYLSI